MLQTFWQMVFFSNKFLPKFSNYGLFVFWGINLSKRKYRLQICLFQNACKSSFSTIFNRFAFSEAFKFLIIINYWRVCFFKWFTWFIFRLRTTKFRCVWIDFCSINVWSIGELIDFFVWFVFSRLGDFVLEKLSDACALNATRRSLEEYQSELKQFGDISAYYIATSRRTKNIYASLSFMPLSQYSKCAKIICV